MIYKYSGEDTVLLGGRCLKYIYDTNYKLLVKLNVIFVLF